MKICFVCNWGENSINLKKRMDRMTKNDKGIWNNIISVNNIKQADYIIALSNIPKNIKFNPEKIIIFPREPRILYSPSFKHKTWFTYDKIHHVVTEPQFIQMNYDKLVDLKYNKEEKIKILSTVTSSKNHTSSAIKRVELIKNFCKKYPNILDIYGANWKTNMREYKGELGFYHNKRNNNTTKYDGFKNYKYSLCLENSSEKNYFSEKFTDCILSWTVPIYFGCSNIEKYFPKDSYYTIDVFDENSIDKINEIINKPITNENIEALKEARNLILNKYNIWSTIENIII